MTPTQVAWRRLLARVTQDGDCLLIPHLKGRYGKTRIGYSNKVTHRFAYEQYHNVQLTPDEVIMHSCDQPACIAKEHLIRGTSAENTRDKTLKGRQAKGERNGGAKLTQYEVDLIREARNVPRQQLADMYDVSLRTIYRILSYEQWESTQ